MQDIVIKHSFHQVGHIYILPQYHHSYKLQHKLHLQLQQTFRIAAVLAVTQYSYWRQLLNEMAAVDITGIFPHS